MDPEKQLKLDRANQEVSTLTEQVKELRTKLEETQKFMETPEFEDVYNQLGEKNAELNKVFEDSLTPEMKEAYDEIDKANKACDEVYQTHTDKIKQDFIKQAGVPSADGAEGITMEQLAQAAADDPALAEAKAGVLGANEKLTKAIKDQVDPVIGDDLSIGNKAISEAELKAEDQARLEMLKKIEEAGVEATGIDVTPFLEKSSENPEDPEILAAKLDKLRSGEGIPMGPDTKEQVSPILEANAAYIEKVNESQKQVFEVENELQTAETNLANAISELEKLRKVFG